jgi:predicted nucleic acid-binding protein
VLAATDADTRARRAETLALARSADPIPVDEPVMSAFARLVYDCRNAGVRPRVLDALIAATGVERGLPVVTQDDDFAAIADVHRPLTVIRV